MHLEERDPAYLWDMLEAARAIADFTHDLTLDEFLAAGRDKEITRLATSIPLPCAPTFRALSRPFAPFAFQTPFCHVNRIVV
jgi:hypothetical protein